MPLFKPILLAILLILALEGVESSSLDVYDGFLTPHWYTLAFSRPKKAKVVESASSEFTTSDNPMPFTLDDVPEPKAPPLTKHAKNLINFEHTTIAFLAILVTIIANRTFMHFIQIHREGNTLPVLIFGALGLLIIHEFAIIIGIISRKLFSGDMVRLLSMAIFCIIGLWNLLVGLRPAESTQIPQECDIEKNALGALNEPLVRNEENVIPPHSENSLNSCISKVLNALTCGLANSATCAPFLGVVVAEMGNLSQMVTIVLCARLHTPDVFYGGYSAQFLGMVIAVFLGTYICRNVSISGLYILVGICYLGLFGVDYYGYLNPHNNVL